MWSDSETEIDLLDFKYMVNAVTSIVRNPSLLPATIGVFGDWGSGKSSLIKMVQRDLDQEEDTLCLTFNGWLFEGYDDAKTALMGTILDEISDRRKLNVKAQDIVKRLSQRIDWFRLLSYAGKNAVAFTVGGPVGLGLSAGTDLVSFLTGNLEKIKGMDTDKLKEFIKEEAPDDLNNSRRNIRDFHKDFAELLDQTNIKTLVVFIDDLDRCTPDTINETLEAIRLFLFAPRTAFILGADERLVRYAVRRRFPELPGERVEVGRDYLEKLIQFPIRVTPLGRMELETYIGLLFANLHLTDNQFEDSRAKALFRERELLHEVTFNYGIAREILGDVGPELEEGLSLAAMLAPVLHSGMNGNPRQCKRFLNMLIMRMQMAESKKISLKLQVLAKLMVLEYFRVSWFSRIAELQAMQSGKPRELKLLEKIVHLDGSNPEGSPKTREVAEKKQDHTQSTELSSMEQLDGEFKAWLTDSWMKEWLMTEPGLSDLDLRPYFYFSRDTLGALSVGIQRMSPQAQEMLSNLLNESEAIRQFAIKGASSLSQSDAAAVFDSLAERVRQTEDLGSEQSPLLRIIDWVGARGELRAQLITLLIRVPEGKIPIQIIPTLIRITKDTESATSVSKLLIQWSSSNNRGLATLASRRLKELTD